MPHCAVPADLQEGFPGVFRSIGVLGTAIHWESKTENFGAMAMKVQVVYE